SSKLAGETCSCLESRRRRCGKPHRSVCAGGSALPSFRDRETSVLSIPHVSLRFRGCSRARREPQSHSFPSRRVLQTADGAADLPAELVRLAFGPELLVASGLAGNFLDLTLCLLGRTFDAIPVHGLPLQSMLRKRAAWREVPSAPATTRRCASGEDQ